MNTNTLYNILLDSYADTAIDTTIANIQKQLNITTGDFASIYFDDDKMLALQSIFKDYIEAELQFNIDLQKD